MTLKERADVIVGLSSVIFSKTHLHEAVIFELKQVIAEVYEDAASLADGATAQRIRDKAKEVVK